MKFVLRVVFVKFCAQYYLFDIEYEMCKSDGLLNNQPGKGMFHFYEGFLWRKVCLW